MNGVEIYIESLPEKQREIALEIHHLMLAIPHVTASLKWKLPFYSRKSWIGYTNVLKNGNIEFCFTRANELSNASGILDFKKRKQIAGLEVSDVKQLHTEALHLIIEEAIILDDNVKYSVKK